MYIHWDSNDISLQAISGNNLLKIIIIPVIRKYYGEYFGFGILSLQCEFTGDVIKQGNKVIPDGEVIVTCSGSKKFNSDTMNNFVIEITCNFSQGELNGDYFLKYSDDQGSQTDFINYTYMDDGSIRDKYLFVNCDGTKDNIEYINNNVNNNNNNEQGNNEEGNNSEDNYYNCKLFTYDRGKLVEQIYFGCSLEIPNPDHVEDAKYILYNYYTLADYKLYSVVNIDYNIGTMKNVSYIYPQDNAVTVWDPNVEQGTFQYYKTYSEAGKLTTIHYQDTIDDMFAFVKTYHEISQDYNVIGGYTSNNVGSYLGHYQIHGVPELPNTNVIPFRGEKHRSILLNDKPTKIEESISFFGQKTIKIDYYENGNLKQIQGWPGPSFTYNFDEHGRVVPEDTS